MFEKILVPLDGSPMAERALSFARELAEVHDSELVLLRVAEGEPTMAEKAVGYTWLGAPQRIAHDSAESASYLQQVAAALPRETIHVSTQVEAGAAEAEIVRVAEREEVDLIVMSTHGRTGLPNLIIGSVAKGVVAYAPCPVMLIRAGL